MDEYMDSYKMHRFIHIARWIDIWISRRIVVRYIDKYRDRVNESQIDRLDRYGDLVYNNSEKKKII